MSKVNIGDFVYLSENTTILFNYPVGIIFKVVDILEDSYEYNIVLSCDEFGSNFRQYFSGSELILIEWY